MLVRRVRHMLLVSALVIATLPVSASGASTDTRRVSVGNGGTQFANGSMLPSVSDDGSLVVFTTRVSPNNDYPRYVVMLRNLASGETTLVSATPSGTPPAFRDSLDGALSGDGSTAAFSTDATFVAGDVSGQVDVYARDLSSAAMTPVSVSSAGDWGNGPSDEPKLSTDGRYVVFSSNANNLVAGDTNGATDVFLRDTVGGTTTRMSVSTAGAEGNKSSFEPVISGDGRYVAFRSASTNLVAGDTNGKDDIFVRDTSLGTTIRVSVSSGGAQGNDNSRYPAISKNGRFVTWTSRSGNLVSGDTNAFPDIFVRDLSALKTTRASLGPTGVQGNGSSWFPSISGDGRYVAFATAASNFAPTDSNKARTDIMIRDRSANTTWRASVSAVGQQGNDQAYNAVMSANGNYVAFTSQSSNVVPNDTNSVPDVFIRAALVKPSSLTLSTSDASISYGQRVKLTGKLYGLTGGLSGRSVWLQSSYNLVTWKNITRANTTAGGSFVFSIKPPRTVWYRVVYTGGSGIGPGASPTIKEYMAP